MSPADAEPGTPDAPSGTPDAEPGTPDAEPGTPDAEPGTPDAEPGTPDATPVVDMDIRELQNGTIVEGTTVRVAGAVVTARADAASSTVIFIQEPTGAAEYSGIFVFIDTDPSPTFALPAVGDLVTVEGTLLEFTRSGYPGSRTNIDFVSNITIDGTAAVPAPVVVPEADLVSMEQWEGVLIRVEPATVATRDSFNEFTLTGGLKVDDRLFVYTQPFAGDSYAAIVGPLDHDFGTARVYPRDAGDLIGYVAAPPILTGLDPATTTVSVGSAVTYTVTVDRAAPAAGTTIDVDSSDPLIAAPIGMTVTVPAGMTTATFDVMAVAPGGPVDIVATLGATTLSAQLEVLAGADPVIVGLTPGTIEILAGGGTGILTVTIDRAAPAGGTVITLASGDSGIAAPATVTVPAGESSATFRLRADTAGTETSMVTATLDGVTVSANLSVVLTAPVPVAGDLVLNEANYDVPTSNGDANCNAATDSATDEFVEIVNVANHPVELLDVTIWDAAAWAGTSPLRYSFPSFVLGPGEPVVVYGGALGTTGTAVWCTGLDGTHIGGARAFAGAALGLNNSGSPADTIRLTSGITTSTAELITAVDLPTGADQAYTREPDVTGAFVLDGAALSGAADRSWTPGTRVSGRPFADASPP